MSSTAFYFRAELTEKELHYLIGRLEGVPATGITKGARQALELAERIDLPLERVDWSGAEAAQRSGYSIIDQIWDGWDPRRWFRRDDGKGNE